MHKFLHVLELLGDYKDEKCFQDTIRFTQEFIDSLKLDPKNPKQNFLECYNKICDEMRRRYKLIK
jgi:hypothetical protein